MIFHGLQCTKKQKIYDLKSETSNSFLTPPSHTINYNNTHNDSNTSNKLYKKLMSRLCANKTL